MKIKNFIKVTPFDNSGLEEEKIPLGTAIINVDEISSILCNENGCCSCIIMKDYATKFYVFENEKEIKHKINSAKTD